MTLVPNGFLLCFRTDERINWKYRENSQKTKRVIMDYSDEYIDESWYSFYDRVLPDYNYYNPSNSSTHSHSSPSSYSSVEDIEMKDLSSTSGSSSLDVGLTRSTVSEESIESEPMDTSELSVTNETTSVPTTSSRTNASGSTVNSEATTAPTSSRVNAPNNRSVTIKELKSLVGHDVTSDIDSVFYLSRSATSFNVKLYIDVPFGNCNVVPEENKKMYKVLLGPNYNKVPKLFTFPLGGKTRETVHVLFQRNNFDDTVGHVRDDFINEIFRPACILAIPRNSPSANSNPRGFCSWVPSSKFFTIKATLRPERCPKINKMIFLSLFFQKRQRWELSYFRKRLACRLRSDKRFTRDK